ncbi:MAG: hypothetical protein K9K88_09890 [Desulfobacterales bacterium]|nr:hypothetical protein [Desulfobacterales bacterium]
MKLKITTDCGEVDWQAVADTLKKVGMAYYSPEVHRRAFKASHTAVFIRTLPLTAAGFKVPGSKFKIKSGDMFKFTSG